MKIFGIVGMSGSGKTELLVKLIPELAARGLEVSTIKHTHHNVEVDQPGKDSYRHRKSGAKQVLVASAGRWSLIRELRDAPEPTLAELIEKLEPVDLLLIEGFKRESHAKMEVFRHDHDQELLAPGDDKIVAVATDGPIDGLSVPLIDLNDVAAVADFIVSHTGIEKA
jgi:molybdopterin-guanine dinucleotide biosynthesis protein B